MNNQLRIWQVSENSDPLNNNYKFTLKCKLENGPSEKDDINFVKWHPKGNAILCGGKDYMLWLMNGSSGDFLASLSGHEDEVLMAKFTPNGGKNIVSSSADKTIRVWSPIK
jgi:WD40 repeat protein